ncbi:MAG: PulJ/GspJ family protein, partial [Pseudomonas sp.]
MTLIEVLVALSIASIVAVIGYAAFGALADQSQRVARESADTRAAAVRRALAGWLRSAMLVPGADAASFRGLDDPRGQYPADAITFLTAAQTPLGTHPTLASRAKPPRALL